MATRPSEFASVEYVGKLMSLLHVFDQEQRPLVQKVLLRVLTELNSNEIHEQPVQPFP